MKNLSIFLLSAFSFIISQSQVTVYTDCNYTGNAQKLTTRSYYTASQIGLADNSISSLKIPNGYKATIYTDSNMKGREINFTENQKCLPAVLDNSISSIIITKTENPTTNVNNGNISVYRYCDYKGSVNHFKVGSYSDLKSSLNYTFPQSLQIPKGLKVELYNQKNYKGRKIGIYTTNQSCVSKAVRQTARSMKVLKVKNTTTPQPRTTK